MVASQQTNNLLAESHTNSIDYYPHYLIPIAVASDDTHTTNACTAHYVLTC